MNMHQNLIRDMLRGCAPLMVWAAHFAACYLLVAAQCSPAARNPAAPQSWLLVLISALAIGICAALLWHARNPRPRLLDWARTGSAVLALAAVAWTSVPVLMLDGCG